MIVGVIGAGAMGSGIAQVAATHVCEVRLYDIHKSSCVKALHDINQSLSKFESKGILDPTSSKAILGRIYISESFSTFADCDLVIEAAAEDLAIKKEIFKNLESVVSPSCILATNTSSLSVTAIAAILQYPERCLGIHFFNPAVLMQLVEVIPALQTDNSVVDKVISIIQSWDKNVAYAKDTPGFIVNKVARPFYSESLRILEEGLADIYQIDETMIRHGFKMGPFTLMDFIGHDVNYKVTESVWKSFYFDSRYRPSLSQLKLVEAGYLGKKSGKGFYTYPKFAPKDTINLPLDLQEKIFYRVISMLINEAADTVYAQICTEHDVETAVLFGLNFPKGLFQWGQELGFENIVQQLDSLYHHYHEERYRVSPYLRNLSKLF